MSFLAGETITAARLNRLQPTTYRAVATSTLSGPATNADVPGATITFTTQAASAVYKVEAVYDYRLTGTPTTLGSGNIAVDGSVQTEYALFRDGSGTINTGATITQVYRGTLSAAGSHTIKLVASPVSGQQLNVYSTITVTIYEVA